MGGCGKTVESGRKSPESPWRGRHQNDIIVTSAPPPPSTGESGSEVAMYREKPAHSLPGMFMLVLLLLVVIGSSWGAVRSFQAGAPWPGVGALLVWVFALVSLAGLFVVNPNEAQVVLLFGNYVGTQRTPGFFWMNPFCVKRRVSMRVRNFESAKLKVNDFDGNPIEIAAVVVWKVVDAAEAVFEVDDYENYVRVQSEAAVRNLATRYPYDAHEEGHLSLRGSTDEVAKGL